MNMEIQNDTENQSLPLNINKGDEVICVDAVVESKKTSPPPRFTEASLTEAMGKIHNFVDDPEIKKALRKNAGLGTEATRTMIVKNLSTRGFLEKKGKHIISSAVGRAVIDSVPKELTDPGTTALWEDFLESVAKNENSLEMFLENQQDFVHKLVDTITNTSYEDQFKDILKNKTIYKCPECGSALQKRKSKKGQFYWGCFNTEKHKDEKPVFLPDDNGKPGEKNNTSNNQKKSTCPNCGAENFQMQSKKNKDFLFWVCSTKKCPLYKDNNGEPGEKLDFKK